METRIKFGVLGKGLATPFHIKAIWATCSAELVGVCNPNRASADAMAAEFGCRAFYDLGQATAAGSAARGSRVELPLNANAGIE